MPIYNLHTLINRSVEYSRPYIILGSTLAAIGFPLFYFIWKYLFPQPYENIWIRLFGTLIFIPLIFHKKWPKKLQRYLPHLWAIAILYGPSFFFSFMLFKNNFNEAWTLSAMAGIVLLVFLSHDWLLMIFFYLAGLILAVATIIISGDTITTDHIATYSAQLPIYLFVFAFGATISHTKERILHEKLETAAGIGGTIAHEIRTPLISIRSAAEGFKNHLPTLMQAYEFAQEHKKIPRIHPMQYRRLSQISDTITREINYANTIIDMLLFNSNNDYLNTHEFKKTSIKKCVQIALENYPFKGDEEREKIHCQAKDFEFLGSDTYLRNILFNLINNALYFIAEAKKGSIEIYSKTDKTHNILCFKDTGKGIQKEDLKDIFSPFFTKGKNGGAGIGLSFSKQVMQAFNGDISCQSVYGEYTEFKLSFPKIKEL